MSGLPYAKFYWNDWQGDPLLALCSLAAQGLWMRMLCVAAESDKIGRVRIAGRQATVDDLAKLARTPSDEVSKLISELENQNVFSRDRDGTIYCRRMINDEKKRRASAKGGKVGGASTLRKQKGIFSTQDATQPPPPETRSQKPYPEKKKEEDDKVGFKGNPTPLETSSDSLFRDGEIAAPNHANADLERAVESYNRIAHPLGWPACRSRGRQRDAKLRARIRDAGGIEAWCREIERAGRSPFLRGETGRTNGHEHWSPSLDFFLQEKSFTKLREGGYDARVGLPSSDGEKSVSERLAWLKAYSFDGRWVNNTSGNGVWMDVFGVGPPPHDPRTLVTLDDLERFPEALAMRARLVAKAAVA